MMIWAQAIPMANPTTQWQFELMMATVILSGLATLAQIILSSRRDETMKSTVQKVAVGTEMIHKSVNSAFDAFKAEAYIRIALAESKISQLEALLQDERDKTIALALKSQTNPYQSLGKIPGETAK